MRYLVRLDVIAQSYNSDDCPSRESESSEGSDGHDGNGYNHVRGAEPSTGEPSASKEQHRRWKRLKRSSRAEQELSAGSDSLYEDRYVCVKKPLLV